MNKNILPLLIAGVFFSTYLEAQLFINKETIFFTADSGIVALKNINLNTQSPITGKGKGRLVFMGDSATNITNYGHKIFGIEIANVANVSMNGNLEIDGILAQTAGSLQVNEHTLTISGIATGFTGTITGSSLSELVVNGSGALGVLYFTQGNNNNLFKSITLNRTGTGSANFGSTVRVSDLVTINNGTLNSNGFLTLVSTASNTARIAPITTGSINGNVTTERFMPGGAATNILPTPGRRSFRFISHPFSNYTDLRQLTNQIDITGNGATAIPSGALFTQTLSNAPSAFWYNPMASNGNIANDAGWTAFTNDLPINGTDNNAWKRGQGLRVLIRGAKGEGLANTNYTASDVTISMAGPLNILTTPLTYSLQTNGSGLGYGWNLIGNPLPSPVEIQTKLKILREANTGGVNSNLNAAAYVWNPNKINTNRGGWEAIDLTAAGTYTLPMHGVFLVQTTTNNNTALSFSETDKTSNAATNLFRNYNTANALSLELQDDAGTILDETFLRFNSNASNNFESYDGGKLINQYALFSKTADTANTYIQTIPTPVAETIISLGVRSSEPKNFKLVVGDINTPAGMQFFFKDKKLNVEQPIGNGFIYPYSVTTDGTTQGDARFELVLRNHAPLPVTLMGIKAYQIANEIKIDWSTATEQGMEYFEVEKSKDGNAFTKIAKVVALGNSSVVSSYSYIDKLPFTGNNYYRIKAIEKTGMHKYTGIVNVKLGSRNNITIIPNPIVGHTMQVQLNGVDIGVYALHMFNAAGQKVLSTTIHHTGGSEIVPVSINNIAQGMYKVNIQGNGIMKTIKVMVD